MIGRIFAAVFALAIVCSCSKEQVGDPYIIFEIHGKVVDADGTPVGGIRVASGLSEESTTNVNGSFIFYGRSVPVSSVVLTFEDKDKDENGGEFATMSMEIPLNKKSSVGASGNFKGAFFAGDVEVVMLKKKDDLNPDSGLIPL